MEDYTKEVSSAIVLSIIASLLYLATSLMSGATSISTLGMFVIEFAVSFLIIDLIAITVTPKLALIWRYLIAGIISFFIIGIVASGFAYITFATFVQALVFTFIYLGGLTIISLAFNIEWLGLSKNQICSIH
ncbi:MAG: hypothetical protein QXI16_01475 [Sulfolobaceae archaeon]